jgi:glucose-1-phosphate adenylyltransferase
VADAPKLGVLKTNESGRIVAFEEKPQDGETLARMQSRRGAERPYLASMGIYVFRMDVLVHLLETVEGDDFGHHVVPAAVQSMRTFGFPFEGYWEDIGTISSYYKASLEMVRPDPPFDFYDPNRPIYTRPRFLPPSRIDGCQLKSTVVAEGGKLYDADLEECVIGLRSMVRPGASLQQVVMMGADFYEDEDSKRENRRLGQPDVGIGEGTRIERAIIDKNARIGKGVVISSHQGEPDRDEEQYSIRDGIVVIPKNTILPDGTTI